ncbi:hemolysin XhlA family protein [Virgibacillus sp. C22-A2]|uniref:Hemolysin XhlA family protein n=1 Tax=Virgibacillus tibetensis TaxID=3042313 RepID=A0ABU6KB99_9BACI|nr:hemolysin XhlA family protein [Virgibacillus sp. C22-A2]
MKELGDMDVWKEQTQQDINGLKQSYEKIKSDVDDLKLNDKLQDREINTLQATLTAIQDDTKWIRRMITKTIVSAIITALIAGVVGVALANIF